MANLLHRLSDCSPLRLSNITMAQEIAVLIILAIVVFFIGRALYRMLRPKKEDDKSDSGCSGCSGCCH